MDKFWDSFTFRPSDLNTTLTYVLMDKFCPCFFSSLKQNVEKCLRKLSIKQLTKRGWAD